MKSHIGTKARRNKFSFNDVAEKQGLYIDKNRAGVAEDLDLGILQRTDQREPITDRAADSVQAAEYRSP
jgi:hypothetical protein